MGKVKELLKYVMPPPVRAFNREINALRQLIIEQNTAQMAKIVDLKPKSGGGGTPEYSELIVSLTSYPPRINTVYKTIETILSQTLKADKVILWLADSEFPDREKDLPQNLMRLCKEGLQIKWTKDVKSYKKLIPAIKEFPEAIIVTADDDVYYAPDWLLNLYKAYLKRPGCVHCHRCTYFYLENEKFRWVPGGVKAYKQASYLHKLVGIGGVLYPPHSLHMDVLDEAKFCKFAKTNDDIWFWFMAIRNNYRINVVENNMPKPKYVEGTQDGACLCKINDKGQKLFERDLSQMLKSYPDVEQKLLTDFACLAESV